MFKHKDLEYVLLPYMEVGMFEPKSGTNKEMVVVNFYVKEEDVLVDMKNFINYMPITQLVDVTTIDYSDTEGRYTIYIELFLNEQTWADLMRVLLELGMVSGLDNWKVKIYKQESKKINIDDIKKFFEKEEKSDDK